MILYENRQQTILMKYHALFVIFEKKLQIIGGALLVKIMSVFGF